MEIDMDAFGNFFLMISTSWLESKERFPHLPTGPAADHRPGMAGSRRKRCLLDRNRWRRRTLSWTSPPLAGFEVIIVGRF
jgi:hypothetical protein